MMRTTCNIRNDGRSLLGHLARGVLGLVAFGLALRYGSAHPFSRWASFLPRSDHSAAAQAAGSLVCSTC
jgi:hypothetical protein